MIPRLAPVLLLASGCGLLGTDTPTETPPPAEPTVTPPADDSTFASACDGNGPSDIVRHSLDEVELIEVACEWFAYQGTYELWLGATGAQPVHALSRLGVGMLHEDTQQWTNLQKTRGVGDCGTYERFNITASHIDLVETREQDCGDGSEPPNVDPTTWPVAALAEACTNSHTFFRCEVSDGKIAQLCGSEDARSLTYQFGRPGEPELVFPADNSPSHFAAGEQAWIRSKAQFVSFERNDHRYILVDKAGGGAGGDGPSNNFTGVVVRHNGDELGRLPCIGEPTTDGLATLQSQLRTIGYDD